MLPIIYFDILFLTLFLLASYQDLKYTIVDDKLVFVLFFLSGLKLFIYPEFELYGIILWTIFTIIIIISYKKYQQREIFYPYFLLFVSSIFAIIDVFVLKTYYFVIIFSIISFSVFAYYLKAWAIGDIFAFLITSIFIFSYYPFVSKHFLVSKFFTMFPLQFSVLVLVAICYVPYLALYFMYHKIKYNLNSALHLIIFNFLATFLVVYIVFNVSKILERIGILSVLISIPVIFYIINKLTVKKSISILLVLAILSSFYKIPDIKKVILYSFIIYLIEIFLQALREGVGKIYIKVEDLADGDIPGFYIYEKDGKYYYSERTIEKNVNVIVRRKNPNGLYPSQISLIKELKKKNIVPEYVPIYKGIPFLPAFFVALLVTFLFFGVNI